MKLPKDRAMRDIHELASTGKSIIASMRTEYPLPSWDDILILGAQLASLPLHEHEAVDTTTVIGKRAKKPLMLKSPVFISHMSFGALSREAKLALSMASARQRTAICSGEGGVLPEEKAASYRYIFEYVPNFYSVTEEILKSSDAIEIKIGQSAKPGMGGLLPAEKVTEEIAKIRGKPANQDIVSPPRFEMIKNSDDLKELVENLRLLSEGRPIGVKIAAGHIERDLDFVAKANPDFVTIDGRGGATAAGLKFVRDATSVPTIYALSRARKHMKEKAMFFDLIITGGLRTSPDFVKALSLGADAVAVASGALMALGCRQLRMCADGKCPMGIATQDPELRAHLSVEVGASRVENYLSCSLAETKTFARLAGHRNIHDFTADDLVTTDSDISQYAGIRHAGGDENDRNHLSRA